MKKILKRTLATILVVVMVFGTVAISGDVVYKLFGSITSSAATISTGPSSKCGDNLTWSFNRSTGTLTISGTGDMYDWIWYVDDDIPWYNHQSSIKSVSIGNNVTSIGNGAFSNCTSLKGIRIPTSVTSIGSDAFRDCDSLTSITIPDSVTNIGELAFETCDSLTSITVDMANTAYSSDEYGVLFNKDKTKLIQYPIGNTRTSYEIPYSVTSIGDSAFRYCESLTSITISDNVTDIDKEAFCDTGYYNDENNWENDVLYLGKHLLYTKVNISASYQIKDGTLTIADYAFCFLDSLKSVTIPGSVTNIGSGAFIDCDNLTSIVIPDSVTTIGGSAFLSCDCLTRVTIGNSVTSIGDEAFSCGSLTSITVDTANTAYSNDEYGVLFNKDKTKLIQYPIGNTRTSYEIPYSVTVISSSAFSDCDNLANVAIPNSVTSIGDSAFRYCDHLRNVYFSGTKNQWKKISLGSNNERLTDATIHYDTIKPTYSIYSTNNIEPSQTITLALSDNEGVAGYYWGTSSSYLSNTYTSTPKTLNTSVTKTVSSSGTYYLTVKDISGNISDTESITFYKTTLNANGGSVSITSVLTKSGNSFTFPTPTRSSYSYVGWGTSSSSTSGVKTLTPTDNNTYYAVWSKNPTTYMLTYNANGGSGAPGSQTGNTTYTISSTKPTRSGYTFLGWSKSSGATSATYTAGDSITLTADTTLYAVWSKITYTLSYNANGGSGVPSSQTGNTTYTISSTKPTRSGYTFLGWSKSSSATSASYTSGDSITLTANTTLYAVWSKNSATYTLTYNANGGSGAPSSQTGNTTYTISSTKPTHSGYTFLGWSKSSSATSASYAAGDSITLTANTTLYAVWSKITYTLSYNANGGSGAPSSQTGNTTYTISSTKPTHSGYTFLGWSKSSSATSASYAAGDSITLTDNTTLYAIWSKNPTTYTLTYNANGGSGAPSSQSGNTSYTISSTKPSRSGYTFLGWSKSSSATSATYTAGDSITLTANTTLYAVWSKNSVTYTLTYNANGGSGAPSSQTGNTTYTISSTKPSRSGYTFLGWSKSSSATSASYTAGDSITLTANTTLYAVWNNSEPLSRTEQFSFSNSSSNFRTGKYTMLDSDFLHLTNCVKNIYGSGADRWINYLQEYRNETWGGSCSGMATATILDKLGVIAFNETFDTNAPTMSDVDSPYQNSAVQSAINYYHISQKLSYLRTDCYRQTSSNWKPALKNLVQQAQSGKLIRFFYWFNRGGKECGHAIVIKGYEQGTNGSHNLIAYDNRYPNRDIIVNISSDYYNCVVDSSEKAHIIEYMTDFSNYNQFVLSGSNNNMRTNSMMYTQGIEDFSYITIKHGENVVIENSIGETLVVNDGVVSGTMEIKAIYSTINSTADGEPLPSDLIIVVPTSKSFIFEASTGSLGISVLNNDIYTSIDSTNANFIVVDEEDGISLIGERIDFDVSVSMDNEYCDMISVEGSSNNGGSFKYTDDGVLVTGINSEKSIMTVYSNIVSVEDVEFTSSYSDVLITDDGSGVVGNVDILASSKGNGIYDTSILNPNEEPEYNYTFSIQEPSTTTISYGDAIILHADIIGTLPAGATIKWEATNENFAMEVSADGTTCKISPNSKGDTTFTVSVVDTNGNVISSDEQVMTSKAGFFDKIIAFFKKLFGLTKVIPQAFKGVF